MVLFVYIHFSSAVMSRVYVYEMLSIVKWYLQSVVIASFAMWHNKKCGPLSQRSWSLICRMPLDNSNNLLGSDFSYAK